MVEGRVKIGEQAMIRTEDKGECSPLDGAVCMFDSNDELSSLEYWFVLLVVRCCCNQNNNI